MWKRPDGWPLLDALAGPDHGRRRSRPPARARSICARRSRSVGWRSNPLRLTLVDNTTDALRSVASTARCASRTSRAMASRAKCTAVHRPRGARCPARGRHAARDPSDVGGDADDGHRRLAARRAGSRAAGRRAACVGDAARRSRRAGRRSARRRQWSRPARRRDRRLGAAARGRRGGVRARSLPRRARRARQGATAPASRSHSAACARGRRACDGALGVAGLDLLPRAGDSATRGRAGLAAGVRDGGLVPHGAGARRTEGRAPRMAGRASRTASFVERRVARAQLRSEGQRGRTGRSREDPACAHRVPGVCESVQITGAVPTNPDSAEALLDLHATGLRGSALDRGCSPPAGDGPERRDARRPQCTSRAGATPTAWSRPARSARACSCATVRICSR